MSTNLKAAELLDTKEPDEEALNAYLRAHGVQPATRRWESDPSWEPIKQRPWWRAFIVRNLRRLGLFDD